MIVLMAGLPGTGKTTLAHELAARTHGRVLSKDEIRHSVFQEDEIEYSSQQDDLVLEMLLDVAKFLFERDSKRFVFLDGRPFSRRYQIDNVIARAESLHQPWKILECTCSEKTAKKRLEESVSEGGHPAGNRNFQLYLDVKTRFEAIVRPKTLIDTDQPLKKCVELALAALR